jgi:hypothetical protein
MWCSLTLTVEGISSWGQNIFVLWIPDNQRRCSAISVQVGLGLAVLRLAGGPMSCRVLVGSRSGPMLVAVEWTCHWIVFDLDVPFAWRWIAVDGVILVPRLILAML